MAYRSLRDFMAMLEREGELVRVKEPVSTVLEMTEIGTRLIAEGGPAVLFENPIRAGQNSKACHEICLRQPLASQARILEISDVDILFRFTNFHSFSRR